ncbi:hypothetical protein AB0B30_29730 [Streptomyces narbonensis]|uniref:Integral membrane protein n=1 Tax=Streptomyces narbonensis TaxID=67333 RepID=A0ABV3CE82_9ACTN
MKRRAAWAFAVAAVTWSRSAISPVPMGFPWTTGGAWTVYAVWSLAAVAVAVALVAVHRRDV